MPAHVCAAARAHSASADAAVDTVRDTAAHTHTCSYGKHTFKPRQLHHNDTPLPRTLHTAEQTQTTSPHRLPHGVAHCRRRAAGALQRQTHVNRTAGALAWGNWGGMGERCRRWHAGGAYVLERPLKTCCAYVLTPSPMFLALAISFSLCSLSLYLSLPRALAVVRRGAAQNTLRGSVRSKAAHGPRLFAVQSRGAHRRGCRDSAGATRARSQGGLRAR